MAYEIVVLGAGYGGILAALSTRREFTADQAHITLINRTPFHQLMTELHQPAAGNVPVEHVRIPLDKLVRGKKIDVRIGELAAIDAASHQVSLIDDTVIAYDVLVVALGSETEYFGIPGLREHSLTLKSVDDAQHIHGHIRNCFQTAAALASPAAALASPAASASPAAALASPAAALASPAAALAAAETTVDHPYVPVAEAAGALDSKLTFVVGGAGLTGVELVGELADAIPALCTLYGVNADRVQLLCVEAMPSILPGFPEALVTRARASLERRGVQFMTGVPVTGVEDGTVHLKDGRDIATQTVIWTGGVRGHSLVANSGLAVDGRGRGLVNEYLQSTSDDHVFIIGDSALLMGPDGRPYPPTGQLAAQMGTYIGPQIYALLNGGVLDAFAPQLSGTLASLGRADAIGTIGKAKYQISGKPASWLKDASNLRYLSKIGGLFARV